MPPNTRGHFLYGFFWSYLKLKPETFYFSQMNLVLFDCHKTRENLLPFTFTRPVADIRIGIMTIREKWEKLLQRRSFSLTEEYLSEKFPAYNDSSPALYINGSVLPNEKLM